MVDVTAQVFADDRCLEHDVPSGMPEMPERVASILDRLDSGPWGIDRDRSAREIRGPIVAVHDERYVDRLERAVRRGDGLIDSADTPLSSATLRSAHAAVATVLDAADRISGSEAGERGAPLSRRAFAVVRPPGHHAERSMAMGFCYFNNIAIAAEYLLSRRGLERVAILDFDVHHGNGTQHLFEERADVFFASLHQHPFYPGTGLATEVGVGAGRGTTLNVPLPAGSRDEDYERALLDQVLPKIESFRPEALLVSAGFDAWARDPLGGMLVSHDGFRAWGRWLAEFADAHCAGRILSALEGGYDLSELPSLVESYLEGLSS